MSKIVYQINHQEYTWKFLGDVLELIWFSENNISITYRVKLEYCEHD